MYVRTEDTASYEHLKKHSNGNEDDVDDDDDNDTNACAVTVLQMLHCPLELLSYLTVT